MAAAPPAATPSRSVSDVEQQAHAAPALVDAHGIAEQEILKDEVPSEGGEAAAPSTCTADDPAGDPAPFDPPFAPLRPPFSFWQDAALLALLGGAMGALGFAYLTAISEATDAWLRAGAGQGYPSDAATLQFGAGSPWWAGLCGGAGAAVGLARAALRLERAPTFIEELRAMHSDVATGLKAAAVTLLGLLGGVPMGPEAGLGAASAAAGQLLATRARAFRLQPDQRRRVYVLSAMCSAFAALLPSPLVAILLVLELGRPLEALALPYMHVVLLLAFGATASFAVYFGIAGDPYYSPAVLVVSAASKVGYDSLYMAQALAIGAGGAAFGLVYVLMAGVLKAALRPLRAALDARLGRWPRGVALGAAGGAAVGALGWAMPLVLTDGSGQLSTVMAQPGAIGSPVLAASAFAKAFAYHLAGECGFSGGLFLPMLSMSTLLGAVIVNETGANPAVALSCSSIALGAALIPAPAMLALLANSLLLVGPEGLVPIATTAFTAHLLCMGVGLPQGLLAAVARRKASKAAAAAAAAANGQAIRS